MINNNINYQIGVGIDLIDSDLKKALLYLKRYVQDYSPVDRYLLNVVYYEISQIEFRLGDINSALKNNFELINYSSAIYGSQSIGVLIQTKKNNRVYL